MGSNQRKDAHVHSSNQLVRIMPRTFCYGGLLLVFSRSMTHLSLFFNWQVSDIGKHTTQSLQHSHSTLNSTLRLLYIYMQCTYSIITIMVTNSTNTTHHITGKQHKNSFCHISAYDIKTRMRYN